MELRDALTIIKRRLVVLIIIVVVFLGSVLGITLTAKEKNESSFIVTIQPSRENSLEYQYNGYYSIQASEFFIDTIIGWIKNPIFVADIYKKAGIDFDSRKLKSLGKKIYARKIPPQNISFIISDQSKERAEKIANGTIAAVIEKNNQINQLANSSATFHIIGSELITIPIKPNILFNIIIAFLSSIILGIILVFATEYFSPTINSSRRAKLIFKKQPISLKNINLKGLVNQETKEAE